MDVALLTNILFGWLLYIRQTSVDNLQSSKAYFWSKTYRNICTVDSSILLKLYEVCVFDSSSNLLHLGSKIINYTVAQGLPDPFC